MSSDQHGFNPDQPPSREPGGPPPYGPGQPSYGAGQPGGGPQYQAPQQPQYQAGPQTTPYGQPPGYAPAGYYAPQAGTNGLGVAGFVTGLVGLVLFWLPWVGFVLGLLGVVLGGVGIAQGRKKGMSTGLAIAGLVCGLIAVIAWLVVVVAVTSSFS
ncbi:hypothetical protein [Geodermatophilus sp. URMC 64]